MSTGHEEFNDWAGAYALGALDSDDRQSYEHHLAQCSICTNDLAAFAPLPGLLTQIDPDEITDLTSDAKSQAVAVLARREGHQLQRSRVLWRRSALVAAAALVVLGVGTFTRSSSDPGPIDAALLADTALVVANRAESATILVAERAWGSEIHIEVAGLPDRQEYQLWVIDEDGDWSRSASWGPTANGNAIVTGSTSFGTDTLARVVVTSADRGDVIIDTSL